MCSFTLALLGIEALDLQKVDSPNEMVLHHALLRDFNADDASVRQTARERLGVVNETIAAMMDSHKSERRAVGLFASSVILLFCFDGAPPRPASPPPLHRKST